MAAVIGWMVENWVVVKMRKVRKMAAVVEMMAAVIEMMAAVVEMMAAVIEMMAAAVLVLGLFLSGITKQNKMIMGPTLEEIHKEALQL